MRIAASAKKGSVLVEFALVGIPLMLIPTAAVIVALGMWQYLTLAYSAEATARYVSLHGRSCVQDGSSCILSVSDVAAYFTGRALALEPSKTNVTLRSASQTITCNPVSSCSGNTAQFPNSDDNGINFDVTVTAYYSILNATPLIVPGMSGPRSFNLFAISRQRITN
jgi:Flp pilus assembly protein TadG